LLTQVAKHAKKGIVTAGCRRSQSACIRYTDGKQPQQVACQLVHGSFPDRPPPDQEINKTLASFAPQRFNTKNPLRSLRLSGSKNNNEGLSPYFSLTLKMPKKMSCAKEPDSKSTITMNKIQYEVMHAVHERPPL